MVVCMYSTVLCSINLLNYFSLTDIILLYFQQFKYLGLPVCVLCKTILVKRF